MAELMELRAKVHIYIILITTSLNFQVSLLVVFCLIICFLHPLFNTMYSIYPLLLLVWSLSHTTFAAPVPVNPSSPKISRANSQGRQPLRYAGDIYTVAVRGDQYDVYTPYYVDDMAPMVTIVFPSTGGQMIIPQAYTAREEAHRDRSPRLHLSDIIQAVASRHAHKSLRSINWVIIKNVVNDDSINVINAYYQHWRRLQNNPGASIPEKLTINPSDPFWSSFQNTPFFKAVNFAFRTERKSVVSMDLVNKWGRNLWFRMG
ncbi:hypothetical protein LX32DRAFT_402077 [Colletotrichum zoysiae]|uniref:Uncharacterized protein n=1 Tax=Colletotrichum zoysiae TaxID=1216348 RepID=A0AAD9HI07_9PEZI|nr:hypothetical protein LX32DRAFT_402077 [Colletotrichum zoysiae]